MRRNKALFSLLLILALLLAACGGAPGNSGNNEPRDTQNNGDALEPVDNADLGDNNGANSAGDPADNGETLPETSNEDTDPAVPTTEEPLMEMATPPPAIMIVGEQEQESGVGSYCWQDPANNTAVCADMIGVPSPATPLTVSTPFTAQFHYAIDAAPDEAGLTVFAVTDDMLSPYSEEDTVWWEIFGSEGQHVDLPLTNDAVQEFDLEPGRYLFSIFIRWDDHGDVTYGFYLDVTAAADGGSVDGDGRMTFEGYVQTAIADRDFAALVGVMGDPFVIALWQSEGSASAPANAVALLETDYLLPDNAITFGAAPDMSALVPDGDVRNVWSPEHEIVTVLFSQGWGPDGSGEAFLFLARHDDGGLYWDGMLYAPAGFGAPFAPTE